jgi:putative redox protein
MARESGNCTGQEAAMAGELSAHVVYQEKMRFIGQASGEQRVVIDYPPPLGDDTGIRGGLELLLMSLAACSGQVIVPILRQMRQPVDGLTVEARGQRRDEHPTVLTGIQLRFTFRGRGLDRAAVVRAIDLADTKYCPVWAMLKAGTPITATVEIVESDLRELAAQPAVVLAAQPAGKG